MSHTFRVGNDPVPEWWAKNRPPMQHWLEDRGVRAKVKGTHTLHSSATRTVGGTSPLFHALGYAFNNHCPLVVTPDAVWLTLLTGLTHHIDTDPEGLRHHFVSHEGKKTLTVKVWSPDIHSAPPAVWENAIKGGPRSDYPDRQAGDLVNEPGNGSFSEQLRDALNPKRYDLVVCDFSTTSDTDRLSSQVALMGAMKHWFAYKMVLCCGLTSVTVEGTPEDWGKVIDRVRVLAEFGLSWWTDPLLPVLDQFRLACEGTPDIEFWKAAYLKHRKGSGGDYDVSGWINTFYPYVAGSGGTSPMVRNRFVDWQADHGKGSPGLDSEDFPLGLVSAPVLVIDHGKPYNCEFYGGLVGVSMQDDFTVRPESGFAMRLLGESE